MMHLIFTGVESTFKSTLAKAVGEALAREVCGEFAWEYLDELDPKPSMHSFPKEHFEAIARGQLLAQKNSGYYETGQQIFDTDGLTLAVWGSDKYGVEDSQWLAPGGPSFYLLCAPTNTYTEEEYRVDGHRREELHQKYVGLLEELGRPYLILREPVFEDRLYEALRIIKELGI
ncbi:MAG: ATP-binding protein [Schleiferiaceae bacterium]